MDTSPLLSALVLNYRSPKDTVKCVQALCAQTIADRTEIIVIDNHSDDESISFLRAHLQHLPSVRIVETPDNLGYGRGNNAGATYAHGEYVLIINPDNVMPPDAAETMINYLKKHPEAGIVGPALIHQDGTVRPSARPFPTLKDLLRKRMFPDVWMKEFEDRRKAQESEEAVEVDWIVGACMMLSMSLYRSIGGFDPRFFLFFEDIDICRHIRETGKKVIYLPTLHVGDKKERLSGVGIFSIMTRKTTRIHLQSAVLYFWKWFWRGGEAKKAT